MILRVDEIYLLTDQHLNLEYYNLDFCLLDIICTYD